MDRILGDSRYSVLCDAFVSNLCSRLNFLLSSSQFTQFFSFLSFSSSYLLLFFLLAACMCDRNYIYYVHGPMEYQKKPSDFCCFRCVTEQRALTVINVKKTCFITMCKAHSKVTHIKQQIYFYHLKRPEYNTEFLLYPRPFR